MFVPQLSLIKLSLEVQRSDRSVSDPVEVWLEEDSFGRLSLVCLSCRREILVEPDLVSIGQDVRCGVCGHLNDSREALLEAYPQVMAEIAKPLLQELEEQLHQTLGKLWK